MKLTNTLAFHFETRLPARDDVLQPSFTDAAGQLRGLLEAV